MASASCHVASHFACCFAMLTAVVFAAARYAALPYDICSGDAASDCDHCALLCAHMHQRSGSGSCSQAHELRLVSSGSQAQAHELRLVRSGSCAQAHALRHMCSGSGSCCEPKQTATANLLSQHVICDALVSVLLLLHSFCMHRSSSSISASFHGSASCLLIPQLGCITGTGWHGSFSRVLLYLVLTCI